MTYKELLERLKTIEPTDPVLDSPVVLRGNEGSDPLELCATTSNNPSMFFTFALEGE